MPYLIRCVKIFESVRLGFSRLLHGSSRFKTVYTRPVCRTCHSFPLTSEKKYLRKDKLTSDYELIYRLQSQKWWVLAACVTHIMAIASPILLIYPFVNQVRRYYKPVDIDEMMAVAFKDVFAPTPKEMVVFCSITVAFNALMFILIRRYPLRIYFNKEKYVAVYMNGFFPLMTKKHYFEKGRRTGNLLFFLQDSNYRLGNRNARLIISNFRRPIDFEKMLITPYYEKEAETSQ